MPSTQPLFDGYTVTTSLDENADGTYRASAMIVREADQEPIGPMFEGEGQTLHTAERAAIARARTWFFEHRDKR